MRVIAYTKQFEKDLNKAQSAGRDIETLKLIIEMITAGERLPRKLNDHKLIGNFKGRRECHLAPDWLLIYKLEKERVLFERTGTHSELFK
jgi:mRNA interferase YafQ